MRQGHKEKQTTLASPELKGYSKPKPDVSRLDQQVHQLVPSPTMFVVLLAAKVYVPDLLMLPDDGVSVTAYAVELMRVYRNPAVGVGRFHPAVPAPV